MCWQSFLREKSIKLCCIRFITFLKTICRSSWAVLIWMAKRLAPTTRNLGRLQPHHPILLLLGLQLALHLKGLHLSPLVTMRIVLLLRDLESTTMLVRSIKTWWCSTTRKSGLAKLSSESERVLGSPVQKQAICMVIVQSCGCRISNKNNWDRF